MGSALHLGTARSPSKALSKGGVGLKHKQQPPIKEVIARVREDGQNSAALQYGVPRTTLLGWLDRAGVPPEQRRKQRSSAVRRAKVISDIPPESTPAEEELARQLLTVEASRSKNTAKLAAARRQVQGLEDDNDKLQRALDLVTTVESVPHPEWTKGAKRARGHRGTLLAAWSDYHIGEAVNPAEMNGYNAYNVEIAEQRVRRFFERTIVVSRDYLAGVTYDGIVMPSLGDTISGDIHDEFVQTNELTNYESVPHAVAWLGEGIGMLADEFGKVHVPCVPGNHPRDSRQPRYKKRSAHNADTLISRLVAQNFHNDDRVTFDIPASLDADFSIYGAKFRIEHGDEVAGSGGGVQGALPALVRHTHKRRKQAQAEGVPFDYLLMGHWHQLMPLLGAGFIVNGSGKGYDEYARGKGFAPELPQQFLGLVTPERGLTAQYPLFVARNSKDEGW